MKVGVIGKDVPTFATAATHNHNGNDPYHRVDDDTHLPATLLVPSEWRRCLTTSTARPIRSILLGQSDMSFQLSQD